MYWLSMRVADMIQHHILCSSIDDADDAGQESVGEGYDAICQLALWQAGPADFEPHRWRIVKTRGGAFRLVAVQFKANW